MGATGVPEADELYALDPSEFVAARNALAKRLRSDGRREEATGVAKLRRATPAAWALDRVAREQPDLVEEAIATGHALREATEAAVGGGRGELRAALTDEQKASRAVVEAAAGHLGPRGSGLVPQLAANLRAAQLDDAVADELRRGVLAVDHDAGGFALAGLEAGHPCRGCCRAGRRTRATGRGARSQGGVEGERERAPQAGDCPRARGRAAGGRGTSRPGRS
jgi:hypothetical protein